MEKFLSPEGMERMFKQAASPYRPPQIVRLKEEIEGETRALEVNFSVTGTLDPERVQKIVAMKLQLDGLYAAWAEGEIG